MKATSLCWFLREISPRDGTASFTSGQLVRNKQEIEVGAWREEE